MSLCILTGILAWPGLAQTDDASDAADDADSAAMAEASDADAMPDEDAAEPMIDVELIVPLLLGTYEQGWVRFYNARVYGAHIIDDEEITQFPFRAVTVELLIRERDLFNLELLAELFAQYDFSYAEELILGLCDTARMKKYNSGDILCVPGTSVMPAGFVMTVLYHPDTFDIVALSNTIDNIGGVASIAVPAPAVQQPAGEPASSTDGAGGSCGPYVDGQWITAAQYQNSGLNLPINTANLLGAVTHYQCVPPALVAWTVMSGGSGGGSGGSGGGGGWSCPPGQAPIFDYSDYENPTFVSCGTEG